MLTSLHETQNKSYFPLRVTTNRKLCAFKYKAFNASTYLSTAPRGRQSNSLQNLCVYASESTTKDTNPPSFGKYENTY